MTRALSVALILPWVLVAVVACFWVQSERKWEWTLERSQMRYIPPEWRTEEEKQLTPAEILWAQMPPPLDEHWRFLVKDSQDCATQGHIMKEPVLCVAVPSVKKYLRVF